MTGTEHYSESERLLDAYKRGEDHYSDVVTRGAVTGDEAALMHGPLALTLACAQVHATLALAAATAATGVSL